MLTRRIVVFSPQDEFKFELSPNDVFSAKEVEEINGEHSITIVTTQYLEKEQRILTMDATEKWREYVIMGNDSQHDSNERPFGTYRGVWSLQHDFPLFGVDDVVGLDVPVTASNAIGRILRNTVRWSRGTVTRDTLSGANMTQINGWEALQLLIENWGGELDVTIGVSNEKVISRQVDLYEKLGNQNATRRFDYRRDLTSMRRKVDETPVACRIRPYGKGEKTIDDIDVKITIEEVNDGKDYLQNDAMASLLRLPDGRGGWEYPTLNVTNTQIEDEEELLEWGRSVLPDYTNPKATYEASVSQFVAAGMGAEGVELGDKTQCVDREFDPDGGVRIESRIRRIENDLIDPTLTKLTLGDAAKNYIVSVGTSLNKINSSIYDLTVGMDSTSEYLNNLLEHINEQINATGGYTYITRGYGLRTYDKEVSDPLVGAEADAVVEMKGGTIRIANSKTATGEWEWRTVFVSGHVAADIVTAANITAGYIGNASGSYWDLDNDILQIATTSSIGDRTVLESLSNVYATVSNMTWEYARNQSTVNPPSGGWSMTLPTWIDGYYIWARQAVTYGTGSEAYVVYGTPIIIPYNGSGYISYVTKQFYLSDSSTTQTGGSWSSTQPTWTSNKFIWTRLMVRWNDASTTYTYTTPELVMAAISISDIARSALDAASDAEKVATNYLTFSSSNGLDIGYSGTSAKTRINASGIDIFDGSGISALFAGISGSNPIVRVGRETGSGNVVMSGEGYVDIRNASEVMAHFGYGYGYDASGALRKAPYYNIGLRKANSAIGNYSVAEGEDTVASGYLTHAEGYKTSATSFYCHSEGQNSDATIQAAHAEGVHSHASGRGSHAEGYGSAAKGQQASGDGSHAEGIDTRASGKASHAEGMDTVASGSYAHASGFGTVANTSYQFVCGQYNSVSSSDLFEVGCGSSSSKANAFAVAPKSIKMFYSGAGGSVAVNGTTVHSSDRRLKEHVAYLGEDAADFIRALKPMRYRWESGGGEHYGFYAQDVADADPHDTETVTAGEYDEGVGFEPLTLDYNAIIAPLVAYTQQLERQVNRLTERLGKLEAC